MWTSENIRCQTFNILVDIDVLPYINLEIMRYSPEGLYKVPIHVLIKEILFYYYICLMLIIEKILFLIIILLILYVLLTYL